MLVMLDLEPRLTEPGTRKEALLELLALLVLMAENERLRLQLDATMATVGSLEARLRPAPKSKLETLSLREYHVLVMVAQGYKDKQIGRRIFIEERSVRNHVYHILRKLGVANRTQAAIYAWQQGVIAPEEAWETVMTMEWRELP